MGYDLLCIGDIFCDMIAKPVKRLPKANQQAITGIMVNKGGEAANTACAASMLGLRTAFIGRAGNDAIGERVLEKMKECGVDLFVKRDEKKATAITMAIAWGKDKRAFISSEGANAGLGPEDVDMKLIDKSANVMRGGIWHTSGLLGENRRILKEAREKGKETSMNLGWDPQGWGKERRKLILDCMRYTDILFLNEEELKALAGREGAKKIIGLGASMIGLHQGAKGSTVIAKGIKIKSRGLKVTTANSTGAGDVYNPAFIYGRVKGMDLDEIADFANTAAAMHVEGEGDYLPNAKEVERRIRE